MMSYLCGYYRHYYPEEFVASYLINAANDDDIATGRDFAKRSGIKITPPRFGQDNRTYYIDKQNHEISDSISSIKGIGDKDAVALYEMRNNLYLTFTDLLYDMMHADNALNRTVISTLIMCGYFRDFGSTGKLLNMFNEFFDGKNRITKTLSQASVDKRMAALRELESSLPESEIDPSEQYRFEIKCFGSPVTVMPEKKNMYLVVAVDEKYSPRLSLYNISRGTVGTMKMVKSLYNANKLCAGDVISIKDWRRMPVYGYVDGKRFEKPGEYENWLYSYKIANLT